MLSRRDALTADVRAAAEARIADEVEALLATVPAGSVVALYAAKGSEVATDAIDARARALGLRVAYPRVEAGERGSCFAEADVGELVVGTVRAARAARRRRRGLRSPTLLRLSCPASRSIAAGGRDRLGPRSL